MTIDWAEVVTAGLNAIPALIGLIGVALGALITNLAKSAELKEIRHQKRVDYYRDSLQSLIGLRAKLQYLHQLIDNEAQAPELKREREDAYGEAYGILLSLADSKLYEQADILMASQEPSEKLEQINTAIIELGKSRRKLMGIYNSGCQKQKASAASRPPEVSLSHHIQLSPLTTLIDPCLATFRSR